MIGWENDQGAYFIKKLNDAIENVSDTVYDNETNIGTLSNLATTDKSNLVSAVNELASGVSNSLMSKTTEISADNIDSFKGADKSGIYATTVPFSGILIVLASETRSVQVLIHSSYIYWRAHGGSQWSAWKYVTGSAT